MLTRVDATPFGTLIRRGREQRKWLGRELAAKLAIDPGTLSRLENGNYKETPAPDLIRRISTVLEIPERRLLEALGFGILEDGPSYDPDLFVMMDAVQKWTPRQRDLLWRYIEGVSAALDELDPPTEAPETNGKEATGD